MDSADTCVEIPMIGTGASLNVAVAGSLVLYRLPASADPALVAETAPAILSPAVV